MNTERNSGERRRFHRVFFDASAKLRISNKTYQTELIDVSLKGALLKAPEAFSTTEGESATLNIVLDTQNHIDMQGCTVHSENGRIGFRCDHIDMDSITHLRRLVELNLGDSDLLERELEQLG